MYFKYFYNVFCLALHVLYMSFLYIIYSLPDFKLSGCPRCVCIATPLYFICISAIFKNSIFPNQSGSQRLTTRGREGRMDFPWGTSPEDFTWGAAIPDPHEWLIAVPDVLGTGFYSISASERRTCAVNNINFEYLHLCIWKIARIVYYIFHKYLLHIILAIFQRTKLLHMQ